MSHLKGPAVSFPICVLEVKSLCVLCDRTLGLIGSPGGEVGVDFHSHCDLRIRVRREDGDDFFCHLDHAHFGS